MTTVRRRSIAIIEFGRRSGRQGDCQNQYREVITNEFAEFDPGTKDERYSLKVVVPISAVKSVPFSGNTS